MHEQQTNLLESKIPRNVKITSLLNELLLKPMMLKISYVQQVYKYTIFYVQFTQGVF